MKVEYDSNRDLLYIQIGSEDHRVAKTETISPGVYADFDSQGKLLGIEVLDASELMQHKMQFEVLLNPKMDAKIPA